jgi:hypothetical protein
VDAEAAETHLLITAHRSLSTSSPMQSETLAILDALERATDALQRTTAAAIALARSQAEDARAKLADDDEWTRLPRVGERCPVSGLSRSTLNRRIFSTDPAKRIRTKTHGKARYFSNADLRKQLTD